MTRPHSELRELLAAYSLDALESEEAAEVSAHLAECPACRAELRGYAEVAARLGTTEGAPPPELWDRIAAELTDAPATPIASVRPATPRRWAPFAIAAAIVVIVGLGVFVMHQRRQLDTAHREIAAQRDGQNAVAKAARAAAAEPGARQVALVGPGGDTIADVVIGTGAQAYVVPKSMRPLGNDKTYQLWGKHGSKLISLAVLGSRPTVKLLTLPPGIEAVAVTVEAAPGVVTSHNSPIAVATVA